MWGGGCLRLMMKNGQNLKASKMLQFYWFTANQSLLSSFPPKTIYVKITYNLQEETSNKYAKISTHGGKI